MVEIEYDSGTRVVLEGPAEYRVGIKVAGTKAQREKGFNSGYLRVGKLVARVEKTKAKGFFVETPSGARVEDLGTEFGVEVKRSRAVECLSGMTWSTGWEGIPLKSPNRKKSLRCAGTTVLHCCK